MSLSASLKKVAGRAKRLLYFQYLALRPAAGETIRFTCNICAHRSAVPLTRLSREAASCYFCGSTVRMRSVVHALSTALFGRSLTIADFPASPHITGIGLSDWEGLADRLPTRLAYTNTFYHQEPFLDITAPTAPAFGQFDFLIISDVFEHIAPPVQPSFDHCLQLLKPGGVVIFTVPYRPGHTEEHFPALAKYSIAQPGNTWTLTNTLPDGRTETHTNLVFHGGPGSVLEMRVFGRDDLLHHFAAAGFDLPILHTEEQRHFGIVWLPYIAENAPYRPLIHALDTPPWTVRRPETQP